MRVTGIHATRAVEVDGLRLDERPSQSVWNHSPDGFGWGYGGSGPAQLALAILMLVTDVYTARYFHQHFKWEFIAKLPQADFTVEWDVIEWVAKLKGSTTREGTSRRGQMW